MSGGLGTADRDGSGPAAFPVRSGPAPAASASYFPRPETGASLAGPLPEGQTLVLVPGDSPAASGPAAIGGTGKTMLAAIVAAEQADQRMVDLVLWLDASTRDSVLSGYARALRDLGGPGAGQLAPAGTERAAARFLDWLSGTRRPWLIVLDDLRDARALDGCWPAGPAGRVLVTTNLPESAAAAPSPRLEPIGVFSPREANAYLSASVREDQERRVGAVDLAADLGFLPLALGQATACMAATGMGCRQYRTWFIEQRMRLDDGAGDGHVPVVSAASLVSAALADRSKPPGLTGPALALISALSPHGIPGSLLTSRAALRFLAGPGAPAPADAAQARSAVTSLARTGLIAIDLSSIASTVRVHPMVQAAIWRSLHAPDRERAVHAVADALIEIWPAGDQPDDLALALRRCAAELGQIAGPALWADRWHPVVVRAGRSLGEAGLPDLAARHWQGVLDIGERAGGTAPGQAVEILDMLGAACEAANRPDEAAQAYQQALAHKERMLTGYDPGLLEARISLSRASAAAGRADEAIGLARAVVQDSEYSLGLNQPATLAARANLAHVYLSAGRFSDGVDELRQVHESRMLALGAGHPDTLAAGSELAAVYLAAGEFGEAIALRRRAAADAERALGPRHAAAASARIALAGALRQGGKYKEATRLFESSLAGLEQRLGASHPETLDVRAELALAYQAAGKLAYAVRQSERVVADCEEAFGTDHPRTLAARESLRVIAAQARAVRGIDLRTVR